MNDQERAREIQASIARVLMEAWDPMGVREEPGATGEYDMYVGGVYRLLARGASAQKLAEHLVALERDRMGFESTQVEALLPVGEKLARLDVRLRPNRPAI